MRISYCLALVLFSVVLAGCDGPREKRKQRLDDFEARVKKAIDGKVLQKWADDTIRKYNFDLSIPHEIFLPCFSNVMFNGRMPYCDLRESADGDKCVDITWEWIYGYAGIVIGVDNKHLIVDLEKEGVETRYLSTNLFIYVYGGSARDRSVPRLDQFEVRVKKAIDGKVLQEWANNTIGKYNFGPNIPRGTYPPCFSNVMDHGYMPNCSLTKSIDGDKCVGIWWRWIHGFAGIVIGSENKHFKVDWIDEGMEARYLSTNVLIYVD
jgi:hypothetical protein